MICSLQPPCMLPFNSYLISPSTFFFDIRWRKQGMGVKEGIVVLSYILVPLVDLWFLFSFHNFRLSNRRVDKVHREVIPKQISLYVNYMYSIYVSKYVYLSYTCVFSSMTTVLTKCGDIPGIKSVSSHETMTYFTRDINPC